MGRPTSYLFHHHHKGTNNVNKRNPRMYNLAIATAVAYNKIDVQQRNTKCVETAYAKVCDELSEVSKLKINVNCKRNDKHAVRYNISGS